ncbi:MAG: ATP-binding protein [candidate division WOR-3 bacterium]|nr:ATP-binding protein [candidate division WOR-3 bacterium]
MPRQDGAERAFNLTPHPRILPMLGEIHLKQWQCIAELIDNSADSFLEAKRASKPAVDPFVRIDTPTTNAKGGRISVIDNGPGMSWEDLELAARAGWTSHNSVDNLGLFGMGFNIATARLGTRTKLWTTRKGDAEWVGLDIDFEQLLARHDFITPAVTRPKSDREVSGTEVEIERLKPDQLDWFARGYNRSNLSRQLGRVYSAMLGPTGEPVGFRMELNSKPVRAERHCVWGDPGSDQRIVPTARQGVVNAYQVVDVRLPQRPFCARCWVWLGPEEHDCPSCERRDRIVPQERRVYGWLGVQRYVDAEKYGFDILRNGRKIEMNCKDLFNWEDEVSDTDVLEYPIDDPRHNGRIVGEIHLDHGRVPYTKNRFLREDAAWQEMVHIIRGVGPLRPEVATQRGYGENNNTPLYRLFQAFRRHNVHNRRAGGWDKILAVPNNDQAKEMAKLFDAGDPAYQTDEKWWALVVEADKAVLRDTLMPPTGEHLGDDTSKGEVGGTDTGAATTSAGPPKREPIHSLSGIYQDDLTRFTFDVRAFSVLASDPLITESKGPWTMTRSTTGLWEFFVDETSSVFRSMTLTPLDALLAEVAWHSTDLDRAQKAHWTFGAILANLRGKYATSKTLDPGVISAEAHLRLVDIARSAQKPSASDSARRFYDRLTHAEKEAIRLQMASRGGADPKSAIRDGRYLLYASPRVIRDFVLTNPELYFDGKYWDNEYLKLDYDSAPATTAAQKRLLGRYAALLSDLEWLTQQTPDELADSTREELMRAMLAIPLLEPTAVTPE